MRLLTVLAAALVAGAVPSAAAPAAGPVADCGVDGARVVQLGDSTGTVATPGTPMFLSSITGELVLALPVPTDEEPNVPTSADLAIELSWETAVSDFDLSAVGPDGAEYSSLKTNAIEGTTEEFVVTGVGQCQTVSFEVLNFVGAPNEALTLSVTATALD